MKQFNVTYPSGLTDQEVVSDCDTVEEYVNRKFGSIDPGSCGATIEMVDLDEASEAFEEQVEGTKPPETTTIPAATGTVAGTAPTEPAAGDAPRNIVMNAESGVVGAETQ